MNEEEAPKSARAARSRMLPPAIRDLIIAVVVVAAAFVLSEVTGIGLHSDLLGMHDFVDRYIGPVLISVAVFIVYSLVRWQELRREVQGRKRAEQGLLETRKYLESLLDYANAPIIVWDPQFRITRFNHAFERMSGYRSQDVIGQPLSILFPEGTREQSLHEIEHTLRGEYWESVEIPILRRDGDVRVALWNSANIQARNGTVTATIAQGQDITERKRAEDELRAGEERLSAFMNSATDAFTIWDSELNLVDLNQTALRYLPTGVRREDVVGKNIRVLEPDAEPSGRLARFREVIKTGRPFSAETLALRLPFDNEVADRYLEVRAFRVGQGLGVMTTDITVRKRAEEQLRQTRDYLDSLLNYANAPIIVWDPQFRITRFNHAFEQLTGLAAEEVIGRSLSLLFPEESREESLSKIEHTLRGEYWESVEIPILRKDGAVRVALWNSANIQAPDGAVVATIAQGQDISERKRAEELSDALDSINATINSTLDFNKIMETVTQQAGQAMGAEVADVYLKEETEWVIRYVYNLPPHNIGLRLTDKQAKHLVRAAKTRRPVVVNDPTTDEAVDQETMDTMGVRSLLSVALSIRDEVIGAVCFCNHTKPIVFNEAQVDFAGKVAAAVSLALENARLYEAEHRIARILQESLIKPVPHIHGLDIGIAYNTAFQAEKVGGDFYDIFELDGGLVAALIGDVAGKGVGAAGLTETIRSSVRTLAYMNPSPAFILGKTNESLLRQTSAGQFVTTALLVFDVGQGEIAYSSAGHPPVVIRNGGARYLTVHPAPPLGAFGATYTESRVKIEEGMVVVLYTDGLIEARRGADFFGEERLLELLSSTEESNPRRLAEGLLDAVGRFADGMLGDDVAIVAVRFTDLSAATAA